MPPGPSGSIRLLRSSRVASNLYNSIDMSDAQTSQAVQDCKAVDRIEQLPKQQNKVIASYIPEKSEDFRRLIDLRQRVSM